MKTYTKSFQDRYSYSRELQILELLGQRHAPVPVVIGSDSTALTIDMSFAGESLDTLLAQKNMSKDSMSIILYISSQAVLHLTTLAKLGVWHLDFMPRNIMFQVKDNGNTEIALIDFSVCVADDFRLKKPLWIRPSQTHHKLLTTAIIEDWSRFFEVIGVPKPKNFYDPFDIDIDQYRSYWCDDLEIEKIKNRYVVLAYQVASFLRTISVNADFTDTTRDFLCQIADRFSNLGNEQQAKAMLESVPLELEQLFRVVNQNHGKPVVDQNKTLVPTARVQNKGLHNPKPTHQPASLPIQVPKETKQETNLWSFNQMTENVKKNLIYFIVLTAISLHTFVYLKLDQTYSHSFILITDIGFILLGVSLMFTVVLLVLWILKKKLLYFRLGLLVSTLPGLMFSYQIYAQQTKLLSVAIGYGTLLLLSNVIANFISHKVSFR